MKFSQPKVGFWFIANWISYIEIIQRNSGKKKNKRFSIRSIKASFLNLYSSDISHVLSKSLLILTEC